MKSFLIFSFLFLFAQLPVPYPQNNTKSFGVIDDSYEVNSLGAYNHIIPIHVPAGINGLVPNLAIAYDSRAGLSELGLGWSLSGLSKITRGPKNIAENGVVGGMNFSTDDALLLDGQYLTCIEGKNAKPNSAYRTENETFSIVRGLGTINNATASPEHFVIKHTNGMTYYYGVTDDSRIQVNLDLGKIEVLEWEVNRIEDQFGNYMTFEYQQNNNRAEIISIKYTGNTMDQIAPTNEVDFAYDDAKRICNTQYIYGLKSNNETILQSIEVKTNGRYFKYYNLKYNDDKSKLVSVVESRDEAQQTALPATSITWNIPDSLTFIQQKAVPIANFEKSRILDINNDGKDEKIFIEKKNNKGIDSISFSIYSGESSGFTKLLFQKNLDAWTPNIDDLSDKIVFADLNGDGLVDIITDHLILENTTVDGKIQFAPFGSTCPDCKNFLTFNGNGSDSKVLTQDLVGNGKQEIILASLNKAGAKHKVLRINKNDQLELVGTFSGNYNTNSFYSATVESGGLEELVCFEPNNLTGKRVTVSNDKIVERPLLLPADFEQGLIAAPGFSFKDINLDGLDDIVEMKDNTPVKVWMNDGVKFSATAVFTDGVAGGPNFYSGNNPKLRSFLGSFSNSSNLQLLNLNAGVTDLYDIHFNDAGQVVFNKVNAPKIQLPGTLVATPSTISYYDWDFTDINGDGRPDIKLKTRTADNKLSGVQQFLAPILFIDKVAAIQDGFENLVKVDYSNLKDSVTYSCNNIPLERRYTYYWGNYIFVKSLSESNGLKDNNLNIISYRYNSLIAENTGRGLSGFQQMEKVEGPTGNLTRNTFLHLFPYTGKIQHQQKITKEGIVYFDQTNTWGIKQFRGGIEPKEKDKIRSLVEVGKFSKTKISYLLVMNQSAAVKKDLDNVISSTSEINYRYNQFGQLYNTTTLLNKETTLTEGKTFTNINTDISETGTYIMGLVATDTTYVTRDKTVSDKKITSYTYYGKTGAPRQKYRQQGDARYEQSISYTYDNCGNILSKTLFPGSGDETKEAYTYTDDGRFPSTYTNPLGFVTTYEYEPEYGNKTAETDPNGLRTGWEFDGFGNLVKNTLPSGVKISYKYEFLRDADDKIFSKDSYALYRITTSFTGGEDQVTYHDKLGRQIGSVYAQIDQYKVLPANNGQDGSTLNVFRKVFKYCQYDNRGNIIYDYKPQYIQVSSLRQIGQLQDHQCVQYEDADSYITTFTYDVFNRETNILLPDKKTQIKNEYFANRRVEYDAKNQKKTIVFNKNGEVASVTDDKNNEIDYEYDLWGNLVKLKNPGSTITTKYDLLGRKTEVNDPNFGPITYTYDKFDRENSETSDGHRINLTYDKTGRIVTKTTGDGTSTWSYDQQKKGQIDRVTDYNNNQISYVYDGLARVASATHELDHINYITKFTYDNLGRISRKDFPDGYAIAYTYVNNIPTEVKEAETGNVIWKIGSLNAEGSLTNKVLGNGLVSNYDYDPITGELKAISTKKTVSNFDAPALPCAEGHILAPDKLPPLVDHNVPAVRAAQAAVRPAVNEQYIQNLKFDYDAGHLVTGKHDLLQGTDETYSYDRLNRLEVVNTKTAVTTTQLKMSYDASGNILSKSDQGTYEYDGIATQQVRFVYNKGRTIHEFEYDKEGNLKKDKQTGLELQYNALKMVKTSSLGGLTTNFKYGSSNNETRETISDNGVITKTIAMPFDDYQVVSENGVTTTESFITVGNDLIAVHSKKDDHGQVNAFNEYIHKDQLNSIQVISDDHGQPVVTYRYSAFGERSIVAGDNTGILLGFTSHQQVEGFDLVNMGGRFYMPSIGKFTSADPFVQSPTDLQSLNRYSYVGNNPTNVTDPTGYFSIGHFFSGIVHAVVHTVVNVVTNVGRTVVSVAKAAIDIQVKIFQEGEKFVSKYAKQLIIIAAAAAITYFSAGTLAGFGAAMIHGAIVGAIVGAGFTAVRGGSFQDILDAAFTGAVTGAATGALSFGLAKGLYSVAKSFQYSKNVLGGVNGLITTNGDVKGALKGVLASFIPADMGATTAYNTSKIANLALQLGNLAARGYVIDGEAGLEIQLIAGGATMAGGHIAGWSSSGDNPFSENVKFKNGVFLYQTNYPDSFTVSNAVSLGKGMNENNPLYDDIVAHETAHFTEQNTLGGMYLIVHAPRRLPGESSTMEDYPFHPSPGKGGY